MKKKFYIRIKEAIRRHDPYRELHKLVEYILSDLASRFTYFPYPGIEPSSNPA